MPTPRSSAESRAAIRELLEFTARALVDDPDSVEVEEVEERDALVYELSVAEDDYGKVIGRGGRTAESMRTIVKAAAVPLRRRVLVEIVD